MSFLTFPSCRFPPRSRPAPSSLRPLLRRSPSSSTRSSPPIRSALSSPSARTKSQIIARDGPPAAFPGGPRHRLRPILFPKWKLTRLCYRMSSSMSFPPRNIRDLQDYLLRRSAVVLSKENSKLHSLYLQPRLVFPLFSPQVLDRAAFLISRLLIIEFLFNLLARRTILPPCQRPFENRQKVSTLESESTVISSRWLLFWF